MLFYIRGAQNSGNFTRTQHSSQATVQTPSVVTRSRRKMWVCTCKWSFFNAEMV